MTNKINDTGTSGQWSENTGLILGLLVFVICICIGIAVALAAIPPTVSSIGRSLEEAAAAAGVIQRL